MGDSWRIRQSHPYVMASDTARSRFTEIRSDVPPKTQRQIPPISPGTGKKSRMICRKP